jgi:type VI secretion system secreted protein VgrG
MGRNKHFTSPDQKSMADYKQANRQMVVSTPLGQDKLLLVGFEGTEQISGLYSFRLDLVAKNSDSADVKFDKLLGQELAVTMWIQNKDPNSTEPEERYFRGICRQFSQGNRDQEFTYYRAEIVPQFWLTTRTAQSRIFQQISVPDILKKVLSGLKVSYKLDGNFEKREYCVQYRETDFNFVSRLMEEEGIFYFFKHDKGGHELVIANSAPAHEDVPGAAKVQWNVEEGDRTAMRHIHEWVKLQDIRSGKFALWDQSFQRPGDNFESKKNTLGSIAVGKVTHKLEVAGNDKFEIYDYPGEFAQRFDGIDKGGGEQGGELGKISPDGTRTVELRMQAETLAGLVIQGSSNCNQFTSGHKFTLEKHFDAEGSYVLTSVHHMAQGGTAYRSGVDETFVYSNSFTCIPKDLPYRPQRTTPKPCVMGVQTAVVVGPAGEEIFTDKYGRVKVQFPWDRESKADANSSCWLRVGTSWAGKQWGGIQIPRIGHEVIVQFLEGDPDAPIIIGSVYNAGAMPPYKLPDNKTMSTLKSLSSKGGGGFNEIRFEDKKGEEQFFMHAEKDQDIRVKHDTKEWIGNDRHLTVTKKQYESIGGDKHLDVKGVQNQKIGETLSIQAGQNIQEKAGMNFAVDAGQEIHLKGGMKVIIEAGAQLSLKVGGNFIDINPGGVFIKGTMVMINSGGAAGSGSGSSPKSPEAPKEAAKADPGQKTEAPRAPKPPAALTYSPSAVTLQQAAKSGTPLCAT